MKKWSEEISIKAPAEKVFSYVSDFARHGEWSGHGLQVSKVAGSPDGVGAKYATVAKQFGTQSEESTVDEVSPSSGFGWMSVGSLGRVHHSFALREDSGTTTVTKAAEFKEPTTLAKLTMFKLSRDIPKALRGDLAKIKAKLEGS